MNDKIYRTDYMSFKEWEDENGTVRKVWNFLDYRIPRNLMTINKYSAYEYKGEHLDYVAYKVYGDITWNFIIAIYNGIRNIRAIPRGTVLRIPDQIEVNNMLERINQQTKGAVLLIDGQSRRGEIVRI